MIYWILNKLAIFKKITDHFPMVLENIHHELRVHMPMPIIPALGRIIVSSRPGRATA